MSLVAESACFLWLTLSLLVVFVLARATVVHCYNLGDEPSGDRARHALLALVTGVAFALACTSAFAAYRVLL